MAGSRLERFGTVFSRVRNLMHSGVIRLPEKPIWYDVYEAFPPKRVPLHVKPHTRPCTKKRETVPEVFYKEDDIRATVYGLTVVPADTREALMAHSGSTTGELCPVEEKLYQERQTSVLSQSLSLSVLNIIIAGVRKFYEHYGTGPLPFDLSKPNFVSTCQRFVDKYTEIKSSNELDDAAVFEETGKALLTEGIVLRRRGARSVSAESRDPVLELKLTDMLAEQQSVNASSEEKMGCTMHTQTP